MCEESNLFSNYFTFIIKNEKKNDIYAIIKMKESV